MGVGDPGWQAGGAPGDPEIPFWAWRLSEPLGGLEVAGHWHAPARATSEAELPQGCVWGGVADLGRRQDR